MPNLKLEDNGHKYSFGYHTNDDECINSYSNRDSSHRNTCVYTTSNINKSNLINQESFICNKITVKENNKNKENDCNDKDIENKTK